MRAVIYARYSSAAQREESIEGQLRECHDYAKKHDLVVVGEYVDRALSGKTDKRPDFLRLIKDSEKGRFDAVIMYTLDRFARNRYDSATYKAKLKKNGVRVLYAKQAIPDSPEGIILESVLEGYAEYYSENLSRTVRRGMRENTLKGLPNSQPPLGYTITNHRYEIDPAEAKIVREIFLMYDEGLSTTKIIKQCNALGYKTKRGRPFAGNSVSGILRNRKYIGEYIFGGVKVDGAIPPIIDKPLFNRVQERRERNAKLRARSKAPEEYLLTGKLFCGKCGTMMAADSGHSKTGKIYRYYKCSKRKNHNACTKKAEKKDVLERAVVDATKKLLTDEAIEQIAAEAYKVVVQELADTTTLDSLRVQLRETEKKIKNLLDAIEEGIFTATTKTRLQDLEAQRADLIGGIAEEEKQKPTISQADILAWLKSFQRGDVDDLDYKRKLIDTMVKAIYVYDDDDHGGRRLVITFNVAEADPVAVDLFEFCTKRCTKRRFSRIAGASFFSSQNNRGVPQRPRSTSSYFPICPRAGRFVLC